MECPECGHTDESEAFEVDEDSDFVCPECDNEFDAE